MKKFPLFAVAGICLALLNTPGQSKAQGGVQNANSITKFPEGLMFPEATAPSAGSVSLSMINEKALKNLKKTFSNAEAASWDVIKDGFTASFDAAGKKTTVYYTKKGNWVGTVRQLKEKDLPRDVWSAFKSNFYDFNINAIREITLRDHLVYIAYMENEEGYKNVKIVNGVMEVIEEFKK